MLGEIGSTERDMKHRPLPMSSVLKVFSNSTSQCMNIV